MIVFSFIFFLFCFTVIGGLATFKARHSPTDYYLADRSVPAWLTALSAVATNNSGFMFIGLIGMVYATGLSAIWIMVGWIVGDYLAWHLVHRRLREKSDNWGSLTIPQILAGPSEIAGNAVENSGKSKNRIFTAARLVQIIAALSIVIFLGVYAAAQLKAGSLALNQLFDWPLWMGATIGVLIVILYSFSGGLRASIWTDAAQAIVMIVSMTILITIAWLEIGGWQALWNKLYAIDPKLVELWPRNLWAGFFLYLASWVVAGVGVVGQPHIMVRAMAIESAEAIPTARRIYFIWYILFTISAIGAGFACRVLLPEVATGATFNAELALPQLSVQLLPPVLIGLILAGLFAATMSTADSQILSCSAAITKDLFPTTGQSMWGTRLGTLVVAILAYVIAISGNQSVFGLVVDAWAALAAALGPLLILRLWQRPMPDLVAVLIVCAGLGTVIIWWQFSDVIQNSIYAVMPGMLVGFLVYVCYASFAGLRRT